MTLKEQPPVNRNAEATMIHRKVQVFAYKDADGVERRLDVESMRSWAEANMRLVGVNIDINKIEDMLKNDRIDRDYLVNHTMPAGPKPVLICDDFEDGRAEIVDGNHAYVAMALLQAKAAELGMGSIPPVVPAYVFSSEEWHRFLI